MTWIKASQLRNLPLVHRYTEAWLSEAVELFKPVFSKAGFELPKVNVLCGFGVNGYKPSRQKNNIAECHPRKYSKDEANDIYITPILDYPTYVLEVLAHELIHAINDCRDSHGPLFQDIAKAIGHPDYRYAQLKDVMAFEGIMRNMAMQLGRYPRTGVTYPKAFSNMGPTQETHCAS